jgi:hypothetical protein
MSIVLADCSVKAGWWDIFKQTIGNKNFSNNNGIREVVNVATSIVLQQVNNQKVVLCKCLCFIRRKTNTTN